MKGHDQAADLASAILQFRKYRSKVLGPEIFGEPAWELLLELFVGDADGIRTTGRTVAERRGVTETVLSRWLKHLAAESLVIVDGAGDLDNQLTLSGSGMQKMESVLREARLLKDEFSKNSLG